MKLTAISVLMSLVLTLSVSAAENIEPPLGFTLQIGGKSIHMFSGEARKVSGLFKDPTVNITPDDTRHFAYGGVSFKYPMSFGFEADLETPGVKIWTLDGNNYVITVQYFRNIPMTAEAIAKQLLEYYGNGAKISNVSQTFNGIKLKGKRVAVTLAGSNLQQDVLEIPTKNGSRILVLQNQPDQSSAAESALVARLLNATLEVDKTP